MLDWNDVRIFLELQRAGTLAGAAAPLGINATTVGRRLSALEEAIGARLFDRTPDGFLLTEAGRDLVPHAERMESEALAMERELGGADQRVAGVVRLATTEMLATRFLAPHLATFHRRHPSITLELGCSPRSVSLTRREADIALRLTPPREGDVVARQLAHIHLGLYAARVYLDAHGRPDGDLSGHAAILFAATPPFALENAWLEARLRDCRVALRSDSVSSVYAAALAGLGLALLPRIVADDEPALERIPTDSEPEPRTIWQGVHRDLVKSPRVQAVLAFLAEVVA